MFRFSVFPAERHSVFSEQKITLKNFEGLVVLSIVPKYYLRIVVYGSLVELNCIITEINQKATFLGWLVGWLWSLRPQDLYDPGTKFIYKTAKYYIR